MYFIFFLVLFIAIFIRFRHTKIKFRTFLKKGFAPKRGRFGVYCYCGKQGSGKLIPWLSF